MRRVGLTDTFSGLIYRTRGNPFDTLPWDPSSVERIEAGVATLTFGDARNGMFIYTLDGISQAKEITRQEYASPKGVCRY